MTLPLKTIMTLCLLMPGVVISAPEARAQGCIWIQEGDQCLPPEVLHPSMNDPVAPGRPQSLPSPSSAPHPSWIYAPPVQFSDSGPHVTAIFFSPAGYITKVTRNDEEGALHDSQMACSYHDSLRRQCTLVDVVINGSVSHAYTANGKIAHAFDRNAQNSARLAIEECNHLYPAQGCKLLTTPVGSIQGEDPQLRTDKYEFTPLSPAASAALAKSLAERDARGEPAKRLGS